MSSSSNTLKCILEALNWYQDFGFQDTFFLSMQKKKRAFAVKWSNVRWKCLQLVFEMEYFPFSFWNFILVENCNVKPTLFLLALLPVASELREAHHCTCGVSSSHRMKLIQADGCFSPQTRLTNVHVYD